MIECWCDQTITDKLRKHALTLELARARRNAAVFYQRAVKGDVSAGPLVTKIIEPRGVMLGLHAPQTAVLKIVEDATPRERRPIESSGLLNALIEDQRKKDDPTTIDHR